MTLSAREIHIPSFFPSEINPKVCFLSKIIVEYFQYILSKNKQRKISSVKQIIRLIFKNERVKLLRLR